MIKRLLIFLSVVFLFASPVIAEDQNAQIVINDYEGYVLGDSFKGDLGIGMALIINGNDVSGTYFYEKWLQDIPVKGNINGRDIILKEYDKQGAVAGIFKGKFIEHAVEHGENLLDREVIQGTWSKVDGGDTRIFRVLSSGSYSTFLGPGRYRVAGFDNDKLVETFAQKFKKAALAKDKNAVALMIEYPVLVTLKGKNVKIKNAADFVANFDQIFNQDFLEALVDAVPHNMFARYNGVMLRLCGLSAVWIGERNGLARVIAIFNSIADDYKKIRILWRINDDRDIVLNKEYLKKAPDAIRAILGYISAQAGTECQWDGDNANADMSNLKCRLTDALGLGYQGEEKHRAFIKRFFKDDPVISKFNEFCTVPFTATVQNTFSFIDMKISGNEVIVDYEMSWINSRDDKGGRHHGRDKFYFYNDSVIRVSHKILEEKKY